MLSRDPASFRDPDGFVFSVDGALYRSVTPAARKVLVDGKEFFSEAVQRGLLLPFELDAAAPAGFDSGSVIKPELLELVSYPHEWCFEQLKDAALNTLGINILALKHGLTLKDASAFNIQRCRGAMVFIDHTSFEPTDGNLPWRPYSQFCRHFLNPLVLGSYRDVHAGAFFRVNLDGIPQQMANDLLPVRAYLKPSVAIHMLAHNAFIKRSATFESRNTQAKNVTSRSSQLDLLKQLRAFIEKLSAAKAVSTWARYYSQTNYNDATFKRKTELVAAAFVGRRLGAVWDVGANDGTFSRIAGKSADRVLALDLDHNAVNAGYVEIKSGGDHHIHALIHDVENPTPALGFDSAERSTLEQRSKADAVMALALIHHLSITSNIPFEQSAGYFADRGEELLIEFVGREDSQVKRLLAQKNINYDWYTEENFRGAYLKRFELKSRHEIPGADRIFYHLVRGR
jgi:hypothetical protein